MELRQLRYFVAVAEDGNFNRAAVRLHITQPALSRQVMALEKSLGARLLERLPRGVHLTPVGQTFLERARRILDEVKSARDLVRNAQRGEVGKLRLGFNAIAVCNAVVPEALRNWETLAPAERWWLFTMTVSSTGQALQRNVGWRKALRFALTENPAAPKGEGLAPRSRRALLGDTGQMALL